MEGITSLEEQGNIMFKNLQSLIVLKERHSQFKEWKELRITGRVEEVSFFNVIF